MAYAVLGFSLFVAIMVISVIIGKKMDEKEGK
ncbi:hypothetical protein I582_02115 [Enterococcus casseliflavus ATCC 49996]|nr:hypothetical protein UAM_02767 [Enterococcus casseliflavus ATCC 49996]EOU08951.1 hypothetical protein I582_02115 [Enterococcus casseliflavus ATCC 49996]DAH76421.1 MAG TPA: hypothetical protein [Caudoviricetes sp.]